MARAWSVILAVVLGGQARAVNVPPSGSARADASAAVNITAAMPNYAPGVTAAAPADGATNVSVSATLDVTVADPEGSPLTVTFYGRPAAAAPAANFTVAALPDTQFYCANMNGATSDIFVAQTAWIVSNRAALNIAYVAHEGDLVQNNDANQWEWQNATSALYRLENPATTGLPDGIPYGIAIGNHDQPGAYYNRYFGTNHFLGRAYYGGNYGTNNNNHYSLFSASGYDFIVLDMEYGGAALDNGVLTWANNLLQAYPDRRAMIVTHWNIDSGNPGTFSASGRSIYDALKTNANFFLTLGGHVVPNGQGRRQDTFNGHTVHSIMADYQDWASGGSGYLRLMTFQPSNNTIQVQTYSPTLDTYQTGASHQFTLDYSLQTNAPCALLGTVSGVASGGHAILAWTNLAATSAYQWYVTVSDGTNTTTDATRGFTTGVTPTTTVATTHPYRGVTLMARTDNLPRPLRINAVDIDLTAPGLSFRLSPQTGRLDTVTQPTLQFLTEQGAQLAINAHFFEPWPMTNVDHAADLVGIGASDGNVYSPFEEFPPKSHAIHTNAPGINIDPGNRVSVVHRGATAYSAAEPVTLWNALAGNEHIVSNGVNIAVNTSWNNTANPRTALAILPGNHLLMLTVDGRQTGVSEGLTVPELADMLIRDYGAADAISLDGGGSTTLAMDRPAPHVVNVPSDNPPRAVGSSLAVFAQPALTVAITNPAAGASFPAPATVTLGPE